MRIAAFSLSFGAMKIFCSQRVLIAFASLSGGVYKGQGRNQRELMTRAYWEFLVQGEQLQAPIPITKEVPRVTQSFQTGIKTRCFLQCSARAAPDI